MGTPPDSQAVLTAPFFKALGSERVAEQDKASREETASGHFLAFLGYRQMQTSQAAINCTFK